MKKSYKIIIASLCLMAFMMLLIVLGYRSYMIQELGTRIEGNGQRSSKTLSVGAFDKLHIKGSASKTFDVVLHTGAHAVSITTDENLLPYIEATVDKGQLSIQMTKNIHTENKPLIHVSASMYKKLYSKGRVHITSHDTLRSDERMELSLEDNSEVDIRLAAPRSIININGSGKLKLGGRTDRMTCNIAGSGTIRAYDLHTQETSIHIAGSGRVEARASEVLDVSIAGSGSIRYKGNPRLKQRIAGSGSVRQVPEDE